MVYAIVAIFIAFDFLTGMVKAFKEKNYSSSIMREGLYHKCGSVLWVIFGALVDYTQLYMDLGITIPVATSICVYIVLMESGSIFENICAINPEFAPDKLKGYFAKLNNK